MPGCRGNSRGGPCRGFGSFILGGQKIIKEFGIGLSTAMLVDAVIVRSALVPALMQMLGKANW